LKNSVATEHEIIVFSAIWLITPSVGVYSHTNVASAAITSSTTTPPALIHSRAERDGIIQASLVSQ
jgi:hypothetical protein